MAPQFQWVVDDYGIPVLSSGGFESVTEKHAVAQEIAVFDCVEVLDIGDHDASGAHRFVNALEDIQAFVRELNPECNATFTRLAVLPEQIQAMRLETTPPKPKEKRQAAGLGAQVEAIAPDVLAELVRKAIEWRIDWKARQQILDEEVEIRKELAKWCNSVDC